MRSHRDDQQQGHGHHESQQEVHEHVSLGSKPGEIGAIPLLQLGYRADRWYLKE